MNKLDLAHLAWPLARLPEAVEALAYRQGAKAQPAELAAPSTLVMADEALFGQWLVGAAAHYGFELEPVHAAYAGVEMMVRRAGPALIRLDTFGDNSGEPAFFVLLAKGRRTVQLLGPDRKIARCPVAAVAEALRAPLAAPISADVEQLLIQAQVPVQRRTKARQAILQERLGAKPIQGCWLLRASPGASVLQQMREAGLWRDMATFISAYLVQYVLWLAAWAMIGRAAFQGRSEPGWLLAWSLLLLTILPFRLLATWAQGRFGVRAGMRLKARLLYGVLRLAPDDVRQQGFGQFLGRVVESDAVETLALNGGFLTLVAVLELLVVLPILGAGSGGRLHLLLLLFWVSFAGYLGWHFLQQRQEWTGLRLAMTHDLVEQMVGQRTRLAQTRRDQWHTGEDQALTYYLTQSVKVDRAAVDLITLVGRGWLVLGLAGLAPAFVNGQASLAAMAVGLGGVVLARQAFDRLGQGFIQLSGAVIAWRQVASLFHAAATDVRPPPLLTSPRSTSGLDSQVQGEEHILLQGHNLRFRYGSRSEPVLNGCSIQIKLGERFLLEGTSGGGKSTLAALLAGLRQPESGLLLLDGFDWQTLGPIGWRQRVAAAPQFHENHVLTETFAFNLLMGRRWPPHPSDLQEAERLCYELGLGPLLERMPAGLLQMVGESGWQLSHGERSRLYLARALLQGGDIVILDESFAALDPENLQRALQTVLRQAKTLLVIAHP